MEGMIDVLTGVRDDDGLPALFQPNYVMGSLHLDDAGKWVRIDLPDFPPAYQREGLWDAVGRARDAGVWQPEFHAAYHYDPARRVAAALSSDVAREVTERGIMLFPGSEEARELGSGRSVGDRRRDFDHALTVFRGLFGSGPEAIMAPDYAWDASMERMWVERGIRIIQGKREQRNPGLGPGTFGRGMKFLGRRWDKVMRPGRIYLERNCRLEPVQAVEPSFVVQSCLAEVRSAWTDGQPAIVETHRVNYAHTDPAVVQTGQGALAGFLGALTSGTGAKPRFLSDREVGALMTRGTSWALRGDELVVRNATRGRKVVVIPTELLREWPRGTGSGKAKQDFWIVPVGGRQVQKLDATGSVIWRGQIR